LVVGYILVTTETDMEREVYRNLAKMKKIQEVHLLFGEYDLIAKTEARDFDSLGRFVLKKIRSIDGVMDTETLTGVKF